MHLLFLCKNYALMCKTDRIPTRTLPINLIIVSDCRARIIIKA
jgi:hypothetical protein